MNLDPYQVGYFITQVGLSAASFGVTEDDVTAVGESLNKAFGYKCEPSAPVVPAQGSQLQSICQADSCPLSPNDTCSAYGTSVEPKVANATLAMGEGDNSTSPSSSSSATGTATGTATGASGSATDSSKPNSGGSLMGISLSIIGAAAFALAL